jgi:hypothetical protein
MGECAGQFEKILIPALSVEDFSDFSLKLIYLQK